MTTPVSRARQLHGALRLRLSITLTDVITYDGQVESSPPVIAASGNRVKPYCVVWTGGGYAGRIRFNGHGLFWTPYITCVAGYQEDCSNLCDRVREQLLSWVLDIGANDTVYGLVELNNDTPIRRDDEHSPPRFYASLQYRTVAARKVA